MSRCLFRMRFLKKSKGHGINNFSKSKNTPSQNGSFKLKYFGSIASMMCFLTVGFSKRLLLKVSQLLGLNLRRLFTMPSNLSAKKLVPNKRKSYIQTHVLIVTGGKIFQNWMV